MKRIVASNVLTRLASSRILFVDDSEMMLEILYTCLKTWNVPDAVSAETPEQCLDALAKGPFDALIVDWKLKDADGVALARRIRTRLPDPVRRIPIVLCTGYSERERVIEARDAGINEMLCKPFTPKQLFLKLGAALTDGRTFVVTDEYTGPERRTMREILAKDEDSERRAEPRPRP